MTIPGFARIGCSLCTLAAVSLSAGALAAQEQESQFPETAGAAIRVYEENVDISEWARGPVEYIMLGYERELWDALEIDAEREAFRQWFWDRRDPDPRDDDHEPREKFYERVAYANQRFNGFPRGWRSDRGRVWVTLGRPSGGMRRTALNNYGRCSAREGEWWTYYTNNMAFQASFGEFNVIFVETRIGEYRICDPSMMGVGAYPVMLRQAFQISTEALVLDTVTEFDTSLDMARRSAGVLPVREIEGTVEPLDVPAEEWGTGGVGGMVVVPVVIPLRDLLFEPVGEQLRATLEVEAGLVAMGEQEGRAGTQQWTIDLDSESANAIGSASLRTAIVLPAEAGGFGAQLRITEPLSGRVLTWEDAVEVSGEGAAASPPLVGRTMIQLREGGEVAVLSGRPSTLATGEPFVAVSWVRGLVVDSEAVVLKLVAADGTETVIEPEQIAWGNQAAAGPLVVQAMLPDLAAGRYVLSLDVGGGVDPVETVVEVE